MARELRLVAPCVAAPATEKNAVFAFNRQHKLQGKRYKLASISFASLHLSFTLGNLQKIIKFASRLWKSLRVNTVEGAILFIYVPCCSKVHEEFGMGMGLESLLYCYSVHTESSAKLILMMTFKE